MQTHLWFKSSPLLAACSARALERLFPTRRRALLLVNWAAGGLAVIGAALMLAHAVSVDSELTRAVEAFQLRTAGSSATTKVESASAALAQRYLQTLDPALRQRISDQVRGEQRTGLTPQGRSAFVLRRLELYEAARQRSRSGPVGPGSLLERGQ